MNQPLKITISNPCSENWEEMKVSAAGRFCTSCEKHVIDFSKQTDVQIKSFMKKHASEQVCGRFYNHQIDRIRIEFEENILQSEIKFWQKFLVILLICFGSEAIGVDFCLAQSDAPHKIAVDTSKIQETKPENKNVPLQQSAELKHIAVYGNSFSTGRVIISTLNKTKKLKKTGKDSNFKPDEIIEAFENKTTVDPASTPKVDLDAPIRAFKRNKPVQQIDFD